MTLKLYQCINVLIHQTTTSDQDVYYLTNTPTLTADPDRLPAALVHYLASTPPGRSKICYFYMVCNVRNVLRKYREGRHLKRFIFEGNSKG